MGRAAGQDAAVILLDTQVIVWSAAGDDRLGRTARMTIAAEPDRRASTMVAWEIAMNARKGRLTLDMPSNRWIAMVFTGLDLREVAVSRDIAWDAGQLPDDIHGDPGDRIMIATARTLECPLLTSDRAILRHAAAGHLKAIDARV